MMWIWVVLLVAGVGYFIWSRRGSSGIQQLNATALQERLKDGASALEVIDVREPFEFQGGHIAKAKNMPLGKIADRLEELKNGNKEVVFVCRSGGRSMMAARKAQKAGLKSIYNLSGGMSAWTGPVKK